MLEENNELSILIYPDQKEEVKDLNKHIKYVYISESILFEYDRYMYEAGNIFATVNLKNIRIGKEHINLFPETIKDPVYLVELQRVIEEDDKERLIYYQGFYDVKNKE